jgi:hypothetical protein
MMMSYEQALRELERFMEGKMNRTPVEALAVILNELLKEKHLGPVGYNSFIPSVNDSLK